MFGPMRRSKSVFLTIMVTTALAAASCGASGAASPSATKLPFGLVTSGYLTVANYGSLPPFLTVSGNALGGVEGDLLARFAAHYGLKVEAIDTVFASVILDVEDQKADVGTYYYYTAARAGHAYYTYPFLGDRTVIMTLPSFNYTGISSCKTAGTVTGFVWAPYLQTALGSSALLFPSVAAVGAALLNGQIQCYVDGATSNASPPLSPSQVAEHPLSAGDWGIPQSDVVEDAYNILNCGSSQLAKAIDQFQSTLYQSGAWTTILTQNGLTPSLATAPLQAPQEMCG